jgi:probable HAF family extracellular repeat protein
MKRQILSLAVVMAFLCPAALQAEIAYKVIDLGTLGGDWSGVSSISDAGQIVGEAENSQGDWHATLFDPTGAGKNIDLGTLAGYGYSYAISINEAGQIVGETMAECWPLPFCPRRAVLFDPTGAANNIDLGTLGGDSSEACHINGAGQIVGAAYNSQDRERATLFDPTGAGNNIDLGALGGDESYANSINDAGQIVGCADDDRGWARATLFDGTGAGNNIDLNTLIDPASGWTLEVAYDINNSGWIVGGGINPQGEYHAFLLVPQPPCLYRLAGDLNDDCKVDFADFAVMAANWLVDCGAVPTDPACVPK